MKIVSKTAPGKMNSPKVLNVNKEISSNRQIVQDVGKSIINKQKKDKRKINSIHIHK